MIRTALKHWIYDKCIDVLFDSIFSNFIEGMHSPEYKRGMKYYSMQTKHKFKSNGKSYDVWKTYYDVEIVDLLEAFIVIKYHAITVASDSDDYFRCISRTNEFYESTTVREGIPFRHYNDIHEREWIYPYQIVDKTSHTPNLKKEIKF